MAAAPPLTTRVAATVRDGSRIDDCQLISIGRNQARSLWLFANGTDTFVPAPEVLDLWEAVAKVA